jgi:hypothetical protein
MPTARVGPRADRVRSHPSRPFASVNERQGQTGVTTCVLLTSVPPAVR